MIEKVPRRGKCRQRVISWVIRKWEKSPWFFNAAGAVLAMVVGMATAFESIPGVNFRTALWGAVGLLAAFFLTTGPILLASRAESLAKLRRRISQLEGNQKRLQEAQARDLAELKRVLDESGHQLLKECCIHDNETRISVYQHHDQERRFVLVGRASKSPTLCEAGRASYPDNRGLIADAWQKGTAHDTVRYTDVEKWINYQVNNKGLIRSDAEHIKMKSRSYLGVRIDDDDTRPLGILMLESLEKDTVTTKHAETASSHPAFARLRALLRAAPTPPPAFEEVL